MIRFGKNELYYKLVAFYTITCGKFIIDMSSTNGEIFDMHILITGGTGFIGTQISRHFTNLGHQVTILTRDVHKVNHGTESAHFITELDNIVSFYEVIINLAGESLNKKRWNENVKSDIYQSRIQTTHKIINYIKNVEVKPKLLISGSAIGFYGSSIEQIFKEDSEPADKGFTHNLCHNWEKMALEASQYGVRVCLMRTGIVLGKDGGALKEMLTPFKFGLGAQLGNGKQWMSWIHMDDVIMAMVYLINHENLNGAFNLTAPEPVTNKVFTYELAKVLRRPAILVLPNFIVKMMFGEMAEFLLLKGQKVIPEKLLTAGYTFKFNTLASALKNILQ
jgi:uncharacterized protein (TIGR01777 family)